MHLGRQLNCWSLRCSWSSACRRCSNYIFIHNLTPGFNGLSNDNCKTRRESFKFWDLVRLILRDFTVLVMIVMDDLVGDGGQNGCPEWSLHYYHSMPMELWPWAAASKYETLNTLRPRRNEQHFADDTFKRIFFNENVWILIKISLKFVPKDPINNIPALVQIMALRRSGDKPYMALWSQTT